MSWTRETLLARLKKLSDDALLENKQKPGIVCHLLVDGQRVLSYDEYPNSIAIVTKEPKFLQRCYEILDISGVASHILSINQDIARSRGVELTCSSNSPGKLSQWLKAIFETDSPTTLIPDTNVIMNHYVSKLLHPLLGNALFEKIRIGIPRLVVLELERMGNESSDDKKRKALYAFTELHWLLGRGANLLPVIDADLHRSFTDLAGGRQVDSWIRREVLGYQDSNHTDHAGGAVFLSADLMSVLAGSAEGLATLYVSRVNEGSTKATLDQFASVVLAASVVWNGIEISLERPKGAISFSGLWEGKTLPDWQAEVVHVEKSTFES